MTHPNGSMTSILASTIPHGRENAISRRELSDRLGMSDREARRAISAARAGGLLIINSSDGAGYYQTEELSEIRRQYRQEKARLKAIYAATKPMRDLLKNAGEEV